ncbi:GGDEF domain-containing protein [Paraclostridium sordellii]|uniref:GGDEF domain-containing protein n=1 Tax=Paraclostridium sordellii TaxID=1505 RepID=UPI003A8667EE
MNERKSFYIEEKVPIPKSGNFAIYQTIKTPIIDKQGNIHGLIGSVRDITKSKLIEERLRDLSYKDILTGLYNRTYFEEKISEIKKSDSFSIGVVIGDIDGLKKVNDTLGHIEGDNFIKSIANILKETCGDKGIVFRWGGDEFISLLIDVDEDDCKKYVDKVNLVCKNRYYKNLKVSISQGYSIFNEKSDIDKVLREADFMLYKDKKEPAK